MSALPPHPIMNATGQVEDDLPLLRLMLEDARQAPSEYQPTNFWSVYEERFIPELEQRGLKDFRRREKSVLYSFGAAIYARRPPLAWAWLRWLPRPLHEELRECLYRTGYYRGKRQRALTTYCEIADAFGRQTGARPLSEVSASLVGNPHEVVEWRGKWYDVEFLHYYMFYAWARPFIPFERIGVYVELGGGLGLQVLLLKQLFPDMTCLIFDLPTQLYVCEQYLKRNFPDRVVSYRETRGLDDLRELHPGGIYLFGAFKLPLMQDAQIDLFWNANSFQEMEPDVVANYMSCVRHADYVVLREMLKGQHVASEKGRVGVLEQTGYKHYINNLAPTHEVMGMGPSVHVEHSEMIRQWYVDSAWRRRE